MAAKRNSDERIVAEHPKLAGQRVVMTRKQLSEVYAEKGFTEVKGMDPSNPSPQPDALPPEPVSQPAEESPKPRRRNLNG